MSIQNKNPETVSQVPPELQEFQASAERMRGDFTVEHYNGLSTTHEGVVNYDSLGAALDNLSRAAVEDPSVLSLVEAVNAQNRAAQTTPEEHGAYVEVEARPEFALLKLFGSVKQSEWKPFTPSAAAEIKPTSSDRAKKFGHQIIADGHLVQGLIVPGRNEIQTAHGIIKSFSAPRIGNR